MSRPPIYGPNPWQQQHWDWRAAGNFILGGAGSGLVVFAALLPTPLRSALMLAGAALVGLGLLCVWLEIGRPYRALNVFLHLRRSWMSREAVVAVLLFAAVAAAVFGLPQAQAMAWLAALLALTFVACQARILLAAKGIPAWREKTLGPLIVATALAEGGGLWLAANAWPGGSPALPPATLVAALLVVLLRAALCSRYRRRLARTAAAAALTQLDTAGRAVLRIGTWVPVVLIGLAALGALVALGAFGVAGLDLALQLRLGREHTALALIAAGLASAAAGAYWKYTLVTRAAFNQGFALTHLPVRGVAH